MVGEAIGQYQHHKVERFGLKFWITDSEVCQRGSSESDNLRGSYCQIVNFSGRYVLSARKLSILTLGIIHTAYLQLAAPTYATVSRNVISSGGP